MDSERMRGRVCHGWAFRDLNEETKECVKRYLESGDPADLGDSSYRYLRDRMYARGER